MEGTGTTSGCREPPLAAEPPRSNKHAGRHVSKTTLDQGLFGLNNPDPYHSAHSPVGSQPSARRSATVEPHHGVPVPSANALSVGYVGQHGTHLMVAMPPPEHARQRKGCSRPYLGGNRPLGPISRRFPARVRAPTRGTTRSKPRCTSASAWVWNTNFPTPGATPGATRSLLRRGGQAGSQSAYMQNLYDRYDEWGPGVLRPQAQLHRFLRV